MPLRLPCLISWILNVKSCNPGLKRNQDRIPTFYYRGFSMASHDWIPTQGILLYGLEHGFSFLPPDNTTIIKLTVLPGRKKRWKKGPVIAGRSKVIFGPECLWHLCRRQQTAFADHSIVAFAPPQMFSASVWPQPARIYLPSLIYHWIQMPSSFIMRAESYQHSVTVRLLRLDPVVICNCMAASTHQSPTRSTYPVNLKSRITKRITQNN